MCNNKWKLILEYVQNLFILFELPKFFVMCPSAIILFFLSVIYLRLCTLSLYIHWFGHITAYRMCAAHRKQKFPVCK